MKLFNWNKNNIGTHFYIPIKPHHVFGLDLWVVRINLFWPFYVSVSFGLLGQKGLQIGFGLKYDPTESMKLAEHDYLFSAHFRLHNLGENCRVNSEASF